jgi:hypothetical protein
MHYFWSRTSASRSRTEADVAKIFNVPVAVIHMIVSANTAAGGWGWGSHVKEI